MDIFSKRYFLWEGLLFQNVKICREGNKQQTYRNFDAIWFFDTVVSVIVFSVRTDGISTNIV